MSTCVTGVAQTKTLAHSGKKPVTITMLKTKTTQQATTTKTTAKPGQSATKGKQDVTKSSIKNGKAVSKKGQTTVNNGQNSAKNGQTPTKQTTQAAPTAAQTTVLTCGYTCNPPLPYMPQKLDVLFIGNSFSIDTSTALPEIFKSLGIKNVNVYVLYKGGCSMKQHYEYYKSGEPVYELYKYSIEGEQKLEETTTIGETLARIPYDVVVFQQYSLESGDHTTYEPYIGKLIQAYNLVKLSPRTTFAFNETWAYASNYKSLAKYKTQEDMWKGICQSVKRMKALTGIDVVIPCGAAVQNARQVDSLNLDNELTRDGFHINLYSGRYLLACTFFESIIAPCMGSDLRKDATVYGTETDIAPVTDSNRTLLQNCARLAVANNYGISEFAGQ